MKSQFTASSVTTEQPITTGVLLTNLGSPEQPTSLSLRNYLREFLSDPRVVEVPRLLWWLILHGIILRFRPAKSAKLYQSIWTDQGAPLIVISNKQKQAIAKKLSQRYGDNITVELAMRYGKPSISQALQKFQQQGVSNIVILPLYPQYASPTTGSTFDAVSAEIKKWRWIPTVQFLSGYHDNALYIDALANSLKEHIVQHGKPDKIVLSYHGMPEAFRQWGDPYYDMCQQTTQLVIANVEKKTSLIATDFITSFQSRFGNDPWLQPYTDETLAKLAKQGHKHVAIMSPAFSADCLETLEELVHENKEVFIDAGGEEYHYIAALNDREDHVEALLSVLEPALYALR